MSIRLTLSRISHLGNFLSYVLDKSLAALVCAPKCCTKFFIHLAICLCLSFPIPLGKSRLEKE